MIRQCALDPGILAASIYARAVQNLLLSRFLSHFHLCTCGTKSASGPFFAVQILLLSRFLWQCRAKEHRLLRGKTMECVSLIGIAVGKEVFIEDARAIMEEFMATQTGEMDPDDPQASYLLQVWALALML